MAKMQRKKKVKARATRGTKRRATKSAPRRRRAARTLVRVEQVVVTRDKLPAIGTDVPELGGIFAGIFREPGKPDRGLVVHKDRGTNQPLGTYGKDVKGAKSQFDGLGNTEALAAAGSEAAKKIRALRVGGFDDWRIPSRKELRLCEANLADLFEPDWHWSSTQDSPYYAWLVDFGNGVQVTILKDGHYRVRAVRSFVLQ